MGWFSKKPQQEEASAPPKFEVTYFREETVAKWDPRIRQLANEDDASVLRASIRELDSTDQMALAVCLALSPITSTKVATLSLLMQTQVADVASHALWQQLMSVAGEHELALLREYESPKPTSVNYDAAYALLSGLMTSALGRDMKVGEMENVRGLVDRFLRLLPETLYS